MPSQPVRIRHRFRKPPAHSEPALRLPLQQQAAIRRLIAAVKINCERSGIKTRPLRKESGSRSSAMPAYINLPTDWTCQLHSKWARAGSRFDVRHKRPISNPARGPRHVRFTSDSVCTLAPQRNDPGARQASDAARLRTRIFLVSFARLPLCERPDIGNFTALVGPGIDRPEFVGLAILDHCRIVRTLS